MLVFIAFFIQNSEIIVNWTTLLDGDSMKIKNLYIFLTLIIFTLMLFLFSCSTPEIKKTDSFIMNLELQTSNKNKEMIIENVLEQNIIFSISILIGMIIKI